MGKQSNDKLVLLAQTAAEKDSFSPSDLINSYLPLMLIVIVGLVLTIGGIVATRSWEDQIQTTYLSGTKRIYIDTVYDRLEYVRQRGRMVQALFQSSQQLDEQEFAEFSKSLFDQYTNGAFVVLAQLPYQAIPGLQAVVSPPFIAHSDDLPPSIIDRLLLSPRLATLPAGFGPAERQFMLQIPVDTQGSEVFLAYVTLLPIAPNRGQLLIISGMRKQAVFDTTNIALVASEIETIEGNARRADSNQPGAIMPVPKQDASDQLTIDFENMTFTLHIKENPTFLQKSRIFKWALMAFSVLFTCLLCAQFLYAKRSVQKMATLAVQRTSDLTSINSELTDEIMNRIKFQAELLQRNTQIEEANKKLADAQNQLIQQEKMASLGQLAAGVAHEINNPIGFINSNLSMLDKYAERIFRILNLFDTIADSLTDPVLSSEIARIKQETRYASLKPNITSVIEESREGVDRVKRIVQDLKDFSRVDEAEWQWANLHDGIDSTLNIAWNEIKYKATVHKEYGDIPLVECVPFQINQVIMNLLVNAAQAMKESGAIFIRTRQANSNVIIEIQDTGSGIPPNILSKIFDPFFTTKEVGKGTGLGLSLSYGIINKHGGELKVTSVVGEGTTFTITLPIQQETPRSVA